MHDLFLALLLKDYYGIHFSHLPTCQMLGPRSRAESHVICFVRFYLIVISEYLKGQGPTFSFHTSEQKL